MSPYAGNLFCSSLVIKQLKTLKSAKKEAGLLVCGQQKGSKWAQPKVVFAAYAVQNPQLKYELPGAVVQSTLLQDQILVDLLLLMRDGCWSTQAGTDAGKCTSVHVGSSRGEEIPG